MFTSIVKIAAIGTFAIFSASVTNTGPNSAIAQTVATPAQEPTSTTATYGSWTVQCQQPDPETAPNTNVCEMVQTLNLQQSGEMIMRVAIGRLPDSDKITIVFQNRIGIFLRDGITLASSSAADAITISATYSRCINGFCFADTVLEPEMVTKLANGAASEQPAILSYRGAGNQTLQLPLALNGFAGAFRDATQ